MAYLLLGADRSSLPEKRGFSSLGDYARELIGVKPRKAQYLVFIASRLEKLPLIAEAFDSGNLPWTKARERQDRARRRRQAFERRRDPDEHVFAGGEHAFGEAADFDRRQHRRRLRQYRRHRGLDPGSSAWTRRHTERWRDGVESSSACTSSVGDSQRLESKRRFDSV